MRQLLYWRVLFQNNFKSFLKGLPSSAQPSQVSLISWSKWLVNKTTFLRQSSSGNLKPTLKLYENNSVHIGRVKILSFTYLIVWTAFGSSLYDLFCKLSVVDESSNDFFRSEEYRDFVKYCIIGSLFFGYCCVVGMWVYLHRYIKRILLNLDKRTLFFETSSVFSKTRNFTVPLNNVSGVINSRQAKKYIPLKIKNTYGYFLVDIRGKIEDQILFDKTVGMERDLSSK